MMDDVKRWIYITRRFIKNDSLYGSGVKLLFNLHIDFDKACLVSSITKLGHDD